MKRPQILTLGVPAVALIVAAVALVLIVTRPSDGPAPAVEPVADDADSSSVETLTDADTEDDAMRRVNVLVYYPSSKRDGLAGEQHEIFMTTAPGDRAKQILADLISGPTQGGKLRALPRGTQLRQVYVLEQGTAYVDFSSDLKRGIGGGSAEELFTVYSIVNSIALNIPEIRRVGILIDGQPIETLNGHLDLRRPLPPDMSIVARRSEPAVARAAPDGARDG